MTKVESGASLVFFGLLRILRAVIGLWACAVAVNVFAGCAAALNDGAGEKGVVFLFLQSILFIFVALMFEGTKLVINAIHRKIYDVPHPKLVKRFSL